MNKVATIQPAVLGVYAELDQRITGALPALRDALAATEVRHQLTIYPGVDHAFHNDTGRATLRHKPQRPGMTRSLGSPNTSDRATASEPARAGGAGVA